MHPKRVGAGRVQALLDRLPCNDVIPRQSGEVAFETPWELRALALAIAAHDAGTYPWADFQQTLIGSVQDWHANSPDRRWQYYERWLDALADLLAERGVVSAAELDERTRVVLSTPREADHQHAHPEPIAVDPGS
jgi:nitrile hydratase accessory protein